jgi:hypothetical protein
MTLAEAVVPLIAAGAAVFGYLTGVHYTFRARRKASYGNETDWRTNEALRALPTWDPKGDSLIARRFAASKKPVGPLHSTASSSQGRYHDWSVATVALTLFSFCVSAAAAVWNLAHNWEFGALAAEIAGLTGALFCVYAARGARNAWILTRVRSELLRQTSVVEGILAPVSDTIDDETQMAVMKESLTGIDVILGGSLKPEHMATVVRSGWSGTRSRLKERFQTRQLRRAQVIEYLARRVIRQMHWFSEAANRMEIREKNRSETLAGMFAIALGLVLFRLVLFLTNRSDADVGSVLSFGIFMTTAIAGATAAFYGGQNQRSLLHRYQAQEVILKNWLAYFVDKYGKVLNEAETVPLSPFEQSRILDSLLDVEDSLATELETWIRVTEHDAIELGL